MITLYYRLSRKVYLMNKKQTEIRKLDWSLFTSDNQLGGGVNKGIALEDLVEQLIKAMFPNEKWRRTQKSYDEKRDFVYPQDETFPDQKWAECKNYNENLSINTIAPTLVMGAINQIQHIYIFSYSKLNDNAIEGILRYINHLRCFLFDFPFCFFKPLNACIS